MSATSRNRVEISGRGVDAVVLVHGFGVDQSAWGRVLPFFERAFTVLRYDLTGLGASDRSAYDHVRHGTLHGHADDLMEICEERGLRDAILVGHSAGGMIGMLASIARPGLFKKLVLLSSSPRYLNHGDYVGGFEVEQAEQAIDYAKRDYAAWVENVVPMVVGADAPASATEHILSSFRRVDPEIAAHLFRVILFSDHRAELAKVTTQSLVIQAKRDAFVPVEVARYVADHIAGAQLEVLSAQGGHYPHLGAPSMVTDAMQPFLL